MIQQRGHSPDTLYTKGLKLEYLTVGYNIIEAVVSVAFGSIARSIALVGFGLDSIVESLSGCVLVWRLSQHKKVSREEEGRIESRAIRFVSVTFFVLGSYILFQSVKKLMIGDVAGPSLPGIVIAAVSMVVMPVLALQKYRLGKQISSKALVADSRETLACCFLSVALLLGLGSNYLFGFWQADPIAGLVIVIFLFREGVESWKECDEEDQAECGSR